jgi:hypothetical protein
MYYIKNAPENASLPTIFENMRFALPLPLPLRAPNSLEIQSYMKHSEKTSVPEKPKYI